MRTTSPNNPASKAGLSYAPDHAGVKATSPPPLESAAFRERLRDREPEALEAFFDLYFDSIYRYARGAVVDDHTAEDVTQEIFFRLHRALPALDPDGDLNPWVYTIAMNTIQDHWRSRPHSEALRNLGLDDEQEDSPAPPTSNDACSWRLGGAATYLAREGVLHKGPRTNIP